MPRRNAPPDTDSPPSWVETTTNHRRFPKRGVASSSSSASTSTTSHSAFSVSSILGTYAVRCPALERANEHHATSDAPPVQMTFDVHGLVRRRREPRSARGKKGIADDGEDMEGLWASFAWGVLNGVVLIGGSRRGLREVVQTVEEMEEEDAEAMAAELAEREEESKGTVHGNGNYEKVYPNEDDDDDADEDDEDEEADDDAEDDDGESIAQSELPPPQRPLFEKNTFRQPKFFFEWRGHDALSSTNVSRGPRSDHMGHLEFSSGACKEFKGVFSSERWGEHVAFEGWKVRGAGKGGGAGSRCPHTWGEFDDVSEEQH